MANHRPDEIRAYFDRLGPAEWDRFDVSPVERIKLHLHEVHLRRHIPAGARVLEIGAGPGRFTRVLVERSCRRSCAYPPRPTPPSWPRAT